MQLRRVQEYAERHGYAIVTEYVDVETAKEPGRREFSKMVEAARHDVTIGAIICEKVDRLCRNLRDYLTIDELPAKTLFWQQEFPDNAAGKLSFGMMVLLAKHYIDNLSDEVKKGMAENGPALRRSPHRLISEDFFRQRWDQLEEKRQQLSHDLARHQHAEGAYMNSAAS